MNKHRLVDLGVAESCGLCVFGRKKEDNVSKMIDELIVSCFDYFTLPIKGKTDINRGNILDPNRKYQTKVH